MAEYTLNARVRHARKPEATWTSENPVLLQDEIGFVKETGRFKIGDGTTAWNSLSYATVDPIAHSAALITSGTLSSNRLPTVPVSKGGTGATSLTSGQALIGNGTGAVTTRAITNITAKGALAWTSDIGGNLINLNTLAYWNGAYSGTSSNLSYCNRGAFGTIVTKAAGDYLAVGGTAAAAKKLVANATISTYSNIVPSDYIADGGVVGLHNSNASDSNGYPAANSSGAILFGKTNAGVLMAARAGQTIPTIYVRQYYQSWGDWALLLHSSNYTSYTVKKDGTGASGTWGINISGNAATATSATNATNAVSAATASILGRNTSYDYNITGVTWFDIDGKAGAVAQANDTPTTAWWHILRFNHSHSNGYYTDLAVPFVANSLYYKQIDNGAVKNGGWVKVLDALNYNDYAPKKDGTGATGKWGISISGSSASCTGNAATATTAAGLSATIANDKLPSRLQEVHTSAPASLDITTCGWFYAGSGGPFESYHSSNKDYMIMSQGHSSQWASQIATDFRTNHLAVRNKNNGTWSSWALMLDSGNYTDYTVTKTGSGASGTWGINITGSSASCTGNAATATNADKLDGYHVSNVYNGFKHTIQNANTANTHVCIATITISGTGLSMAGFTAIFSNRECLDTSSFILTLALRRNSTAAGRTDCEFYYTPIQGSAPREIFIRSDDGVTFKVYFTSVASDWTTYYNVTPLMTEGTVSFSSTGVTSSGILSGTVLKTSASIGGVVKSAATLTTARTINGTSFNGSANITTAKWGTARTLTVGNTGKSVNGSAAVSWSLAEIGAAPASGSNNYVRVYNSGNIGNSSEVTVNDLAKQHAAVAMIYAATDNPTGASKWVHVWNQSWDNGVNTSWVSQIALGVHDSNGMWYRTTQGTIVGAAWKRVYDSSYHPLADTSYAVYDKTDTTTKIYLNYGASGITSPSWFAAWNGYELRAISPTETRKGISALAAVNKNSHYGMAAPSGADTVWIRTTNQGIIPFAAAAAGKGTCGLGTPKWYFGTAYIDNVYGTTFHGNATSATYLKDKTDGTATYLNYGASGITSPSWFAAWNGYELRAISPANTLATIKALPLAGGTMSGNLTAPTYIATQKMVVGPTGLVDLTAAGTTRLYADGLAISNPTTKNDDAWIRVTGTGESDTFLEIATGDDAGGSAAEQIVVRQYGSSGLAHEIKLLDGSGNTYLKRLIMNGALDLANGTWNKAGDDAQFGDNNTAGSFAIQGLNGNTNLKMVTYGGSSYGTITWDGSFFKFENTAGTVYAKIGNGGVTANNFYGNATSASVLGKNTSCDYNISGVTWFDLDGTAGAGVKTNDTPTSAWWHILRFNHTNNNAYYTDLAIPFNDNNLYYKRIGNGAVQNGGWVKVLDALCFSLSGTTLTITV